MMITSLHLLLLFPLISKGVFVVDPKNPAEHYDKVKELTRRIVSENPSADKYDDTSTTHVNDNKKKMSSEQMSLHYKDAILQDMRRRIQAVKNSVPSMREEHHHDEGVQQQESSLHDNRTASLTHHQGEDNDTDTIKQENTHESRYAARYEKLKHAIEYVKDLDLRQINQSTSETHDDTLVLTLEKPLGFILDADTKDEAIVFDLDDEYPGAAQQLSKDVQEQLIGRRIVTVNHEDVSDLDVLQVAKQIVAAESPIHFEFAKVIKKAGAENEEEDDDGDVLRLTLSKPLGFILDADTEEEAIVLDLDDKYPGAAQQLGKEIQEQLIGRRIITVNHKDVSDMSLMEVAKLIVAADSPVVLEFESADEDNEEDSYTIDYFQEHLQETLEPGQLSLLKWKDTGEVIDPYAAVIGLPEKLIPTIQAYVKRLRILQGLKHVMYENPCDPEDGRFYETENPHVHQELPFLQRDDLHWYAQRPGSHWKSDMHWFAGSDERTHESVLQMLFQGGIDEVLDAIGTHYKELDGLFIQSVGFLGVTHCEHGYLHKDFNNVDGKFFNLLIPVSSPENAGTELNVARERTVNNETAIVGTEIKYSEFGVLVGDETLHGTRECDHRPDGEVRVVMSIYLADITDHNVDQVSSDNTAIFPVPKVQEWLWAQKGRHWRRDQCMGHDLGRKPIQLLDHSERCKQVAKYGKCETKPKLARKHCPQSCNVYMEDWEYRAGLERSAVMGGFDFVV